MWPRLFERIRHLDRVEWVAVSLVSSVSLMIGLGGALALRSGLLGRPLQSAWRTLAIQIIPRH